MRAPKFGVYVANPITIRFVRESSDTDRLRGIAETICAMQECGEERAIVESRDLAKIMVQNKNLPSDCFVSLVTASFEIAKTIARVRHEPEAAAVVWQAYKLQIVKDDGDISDPAILRYILRSTEDKKKIPKLVIEDIINRLMCNPINGRWIVMAANAGRFYPEILEQIRGITWIIGRIRTKVERIFRETV